MTPLGIAVIGSGSIADQHLRAIRELPSARLGGVTSRTKEKAEKVGAREGCRWTTDYRELLRDPAIDVVDIVTSSGSHGSIGVEALQAGKHVIVEKPMAMSVAECDTMIDVARQKGLSLSVVSQRRFEEQNRLIKRMVDEGAIGKLLLIEVSCPYYRTQEYYQSADWRGKIATDGGAIMNQGIHAVDLMLWFAGPARWVSGKCATQTHRMEAEDLALAIVQFRSGAFGTIMASTSIQPGFQPCLNLYGEKGTIKLDGATIVHWTVPGAAKPELGELKASAGVSDPKLSNHLHHKLQIEDALGAIASKRPPLITGEDGRRAVQLIQGLYTASQTGKPVDLS